jgi:hypothetical protein
METTIKGYFSHSSMWHTSFRILQRVTVFKFKPHKNSLLQKPRPFSTKMGAIGQHMVHTTERLAKLRELMKDNGLGSFVVPSEDQRMLKIIQQHYFS